MALKIHSGEVAVQGVKQKMILPEGCIGITFVFESKKMARKWWGKDVPMVRIENEEKK